MQECVKIIKFLGYFYVLQPPEVANISILHYNRQSPPLVWSPSVGARESVICKDTSISVYTPSVQI